MLKSNLDKCYLKGTFPVFAKYVYNICYYEGHKEHIITSFDNEKDAVQFYNKFKEDHCGWYIDKTFIDYFDNWRRLG